MVADIMTKPLGFDLHQRATLKMMGYVDIISKPDQKLSGALIRNDPDVVIRADTSTKGKGVEPPLIKAASFAPAAAFAQVQEVY